jgi:hypothetical protein
MTRRPTQTGGLGTAGGSLTVVQQLSGLLTGTTPVAWNVHHRSSPQNVDSHGQFKPCFQQDCWIGPSAAVAARLVKTTCFHRTLLYGPMGNGLGTKIGSWIGSAIRGTDDHPSWSMDDDNGKRTIEKRWRGHPQACDQQNKL